MFKYSRSDIYDSIDEVNRFIALFNEFDTKGSFFVEDTDLYKILIKLPFETQALLHGLMQLGKEYIETKELPDNSLDELNKIIRYFENNHRYASEMIDKALMTAKYLETGRNLIDYRYRELLKFPVKELDN